MKSCCAGSAKRCRSRSRAPGERGGAGTPAARRRGRLERRGGADTGGLFPPRYDAKIRRRPFTAGDPAELTPEEFLGLQEIGAVIGLLFGMLLLNFFKVAQ